MLLANPRSTQSALSRAAPGPASWEARPVPVGLALSYYSANSITALKHWLLKIKLFSVEGIPACGHRAMFMGWRGSDVTWQQSAGGLMKRVRSVFSVDRKIPGPDPANSSCDTKTPGLGPFPSSPKRWKDAFTMLVTETYCPATSGISVSSCACTSYMASWSEESGASYRCL